MSDQPQGPNGDGPAPVGDAVISQLTITRAMQPDGQEYVHVGQSDSGMLLMECLGMIEMARITLIRTRTGGF